MYLKRHIFLCFFFFISVVAISQVSNKRCKWVKYTQNDITLDSLSIFPSSIKISYPDDSTFKINYDISSGKARVNSSYPVDSLLICYSVLPYNLSKKRFRRNISLYDSNSYYKEDFGIFMRSSVASREELFSSPGLQKTGNISRGLSFGNNQNVFVNSTLNLQMEGKLTDDIMLTAVISDQNIPFQPQGNTQQLQQFDKVYVQLESKRSKMIVGDIVLKNKPSNFLQYSRNVQGGLFDYNFKKDSTHYSSTSAGAAIAKGKFNSMLFAPGQPDSMIEGVQGPYRLKGPNGERFIVVLANSEKIYLDGRLLKRGFDYDYIIDYNQSEITFTNNIIITRFTRIRVDFEFSDRNYSRSIYTASHYQQYGNVSGYVSYYQEKDNPRNPLTLTLSDADKLALSLVGDSVNRAVISGVDSVGFSSSLVLYKDTIISGKRIFKYSTSPDSAFYQLTFSDLGADQGSYVLLNTTANGNVYKYVGQGLGNFEPLKVIPTPKLKQMIAGGLGYNITKHDNLYGEVALSKNDLNLYSKLDKEDDVGKSIKIGYKNTARPVKFIKKYKWTATLDYEYNEKSFTAIDRFRGPDFERNWSENAKILADNHLLSASVDLIKDSKNNIQYKISRRIKGTDVNGIQQQYTLNQSLKRIQIVSTGFQMNNDQLFSKSNWNKFNINTSYNSKYFVPGIIYNMDKNKVVDNQQRVLSSAMYFDEVKFYLKNNDSLKTKFSIDYSTRKDKHAVQGRLNDFTNAKTANFSFNSKVKKNNEINSTLTYRYLEYKDTIGTKLPNEETILGRTDWNSHFLKKHVSSELTITTGTGRELKKQFIFVPAQGGTGNYIWLDQNKDGVQDLNEFVESNSAYTNTNVITYIKSFIPSDTYYKAYTNTFNYRLDITAPRGWKDKGKLKIFLSKFTNVSSWTVNKRITDQNLWKRFSPIINNVDSSSILSLQKAIKSTVFFNRSNPQYGMDLNYQSTELKQFLNQGFETTGNEELKLNARFNIKKAVNIKLLSLRGQKSDISNFLSSKYYIVPSWKFTPEIAFQPSNNIRLSWNLSYTTKKNKVPLPLGHNEEVKMYQVGFELKINKVSRRTINSNIKYINIVAKNFNITGLSPELSSVGSPVGYEMLEALQPGNNFTWNINWLEKLSNGLQLSFNYEGRKAGTSKIVHIGRMQVSALF
jgi:hypothetical protein